MRDLSVAVLDSEYALWSEPMSCGVLVDHRTVLPGQFVRPGSANEHAELATHPLDVLQFRPGFVMPGLNVGCMVLHRHVEIQQMP